MICDIKYNNYDVLNINKLISKSELQYLLFFLCVVATCLLIYLFFDGASGDRGT